MEIQETTRKQESLDKWNIGFTTKAICDAQLFTQVLFPQS